MFGRTHRCFVRSVVADDSGSVVVMFGLVSVAVVVAIGAAVDFSNLTRGKAELQAVADAAALAGARALGASNGQTDTARIAAAVAAAQGYVDAKSPEAQRTITPSHGTIEPPAESGCSPAPDPFVGAIPADTGTCSPPIPIGQRVLTLAPASIAAACRSTTAT